MWRLSKISSADHDPEPVVELVPITLLQLDIEYDARVPLEASPLRQLALKTVSGLGEGKPLPLNEFATVTGLPDQEVGRLVHDLSQSELIEATRDTIVLNASVIADGDSVTTQETRKDSCLALGMWTTQPTLLPHHRIRGKGLERIPVEPPGHKWKWDELLSAVDIAATIGGSECEVVEASICEIKQRDHFARVTTADQQDATANAEAKVDVLDIERERPGYWLHIPANHSVNVEAKELISSAEKCLPSLLSRFGQWRQGALWVSEEGWARWKEQGGRIACPVLLTLETNTVVSIPLVLRPQDAECAKRMHVDLVLEFLSSGNGMISDAQIQEASEKAATKLDHGERQVPLRNDLAAAAWETGHWSVMYRIQMEEDGL